MIAIICKKCGAKTNINFGVCQKCGAKIENHPLVRPSHDKIQITKNPLIVRNNKGK